MSNVTEQQAAEGFAHMRALLNRTPDQPMPQAPAWLADDMRKLEEERAAEKADRHAKTIAEIFGKVKTTGPYTAADARIGLDDRAEAHTKDDHEDYGND